MEHTLRNWRKIIKSTGIILNDEYIHILLQQKKTEEDPDQLHGEKIEGSGWSTRNEVKNL